MKARKKSFHTTLYHLTYMADLPENLCPYFWKLAFAFIVAPLNLIVQLPSHIFNHFDGSEEDCGTNREHGTGMWCLMLIAYMYLLITTHWLMAIFEAYSYKYELANAGLAINGLIALVALVFLVRHIILYLLDISPTRESRPNIIVEFTKAKYHKYCPKIEWE